MWKKTDEEQTTETQNHPQPSPVTTPEPRRTTRQGAVIGPSLILKGEVHGNEDLYIEGQIEGTIALKKNNVTIGREGKIKADIYGKTISVEGTVKGNLYGQEKIILRESGKVEGNIAAPRVSLEDGAQFKGSIDMEGDKDAKVKTYSSQPSTSTVKSGTDQKSKDEKLKIDSKDEKSKESSQYSLKVNQATKE